MIKINWEKAGFGRIEGTHYRVERYKVKEGYYYMLSDNEDTYLASKGPYSTIDERNEAIIKEVERRGLVNNR